MIKFQKIIGFLVLFSIFYFLFSSFADSKTIELYFFYGQGCPYCAQMAQNLKEIQEKYPQLKINPFEVWHQPQNQRLLNILVEVYKIKPTGVPVVFIGNLAIEGASAQAVWQIKEEVRRCSIINCPSPISKIKVAKNKSELKWQNISLFAGVIIFLFLLINLLKKKKSG